MAAALLPCGNSGIVAERAAAGQVGGRFANPAWKTREVCDPLFNNYKITGSLTSAPAFVPSAAFPKASADQQEEIFGYVFKPSLTVLPYKLEVKDIKCEYLNTILSY